MSVSVDLECRVIVGLAEDCGQGFILRRRTHFGCEGWCEFCEASHDDFDCSNDVWSGYVSRYVKCIRGKCGKSLSRKQCRMYILCTSLVIIHCTSTSTSTLH